MSMLSYSSFNKHGTSHTVSRRSLGESLPLPRHPSHLQPHDPPATPSLTINICCQPRQQPALHLLCLQCHSHQPQELHGTLTGAPPATPTEIPRYLLKPSGVPTNTSIFRGYQKNSMGESSMQPLLLIQRISEVMSTTRNLQASCEHPRSLRFQRMRTFSWSLTAMCSLKGALNSQAVLH